MADEPPAPRVRARRDRPPARTPTRRSGPSCGPRSTQFSRVLPIETSGLGGLRRADHLPPRRLRRPGPLRRARDPPRRDRRRSAARAGNRCYYLATQPSAFAEIIAGLGRAGLDHEHARRRAGGGSSSRSRSAATSRAPIRLNREVGKVFRESQVYRIDHYLGKETVRNILVFRFGNGIFEPIWHRRYVDHVQITVAESIGVEKRGSFYEEAGASRDILQNHLMQLLALVAMEPPATFDADALRDEKVKVLRAIEPMAPRDVAANVVRGQYGPGWVAGEPVAGYREEDEVDPESETETYVAARLFVDDWRWAGVPFYLRAGKRLPKRATEIAIQFKQVPHALFKESSTDPEANLLALRIQPDEGILLRFAAKVPGLGVDVRSVNMDFTYGSAFSVDSPDAYETLILDALLGDASLFTRADEVEKAWAIVTPIIDAWADDAAAGLPRTTPRAAGGPTPRTRSSPGTDAGGGGSERRRAAGSAERRRAGRSSPFGIAADAGRADAPLGGSRDLGRRDRARARPDLEPPARRWRRATGRPSGTSPRAPASSTSSWWPARPSSASRPPRRSRWGPGATRRGR